MIKIVTDTIACLPPELVKKYDIKIIPISLVIDEKIYRDDQLSNDEFWKLFYAAKTTSTQAASPGEFAALFESLSGTTDTIFCIPVSKGLSTTYEAAMQAREIVQKTNNKLRVEVIDSRSCTGAQGFLVLEAARAAEAGKSAEEIKQLVEEMIPRVKMLTILETLKYIIRIGRAPKTAVIGELFQV
ncbi:MAG TPA: DegV family protein, partial [Dehalococcoidales bacterium]|nr:DegV family protein [Dehalococcoidales bacterium]